MAGKQAQGKVDPIPVTGPAAENIKAVTGQIEKIVRDWETLRAVRQNAINLAAELVGGVPPGWQFNLDNMRFEPPASEE